jgi:quinol monooxygenase YgiN
MIVMLVSFEVDADAIELDRWIIPLFQRERQEPGVVTYDYLIDPEHPGRRRVIEVFADRDALQRHVTSPAHVEMLALGSMEYGMRDFDIHTWESADGYCHTTRLRSDFHEEGRELVEGLVAEFQQRRVTGKQT